MALSSFTLKKTIVSGGSALRRTHVNQDASDPAGSGDVVEDSGLRSDGFVIGVPTAADESTFFADIYERGQIELGWSLSVALSDTPVAGSDPNVYEAVEILIRGSGQGEPETAADGVQVTSVIYSNYRESYTDVAGAGRPYIADGRWAYYSMFVRYQNYLGDAFYEKITSISIQMPYNFGSADLLWNKIPAYYREADNAYVLQNEKTYNYTSGPLRRFIDLIGWELDQYRSTIYDTQRINDPDVIHSSAIDALATQMGVPFTKDILGTEKLRVILDNIGHLQRTKGTLNSIQEYISALTGSRVSYDASGTPVVFNVHPQRVNLTTDPLYQNPATTTDSVGDVYRKFFAGLDGIREHGWGVYVDQDSSVTTPPSITVSGGAVQVVLDAGTGTSNVYLYSRGAFTYNNDLTYYASAETGASFSLRFVDSAHVTTELESGSPLVTFYDSWNNNLSASAVPVYSNINAPNRRIVGSVPSTTTPEDKTVVPVFAFEVNHSAGASATLNFSKPLVEPNGATGVFFTGNSALGPFDYRWGPSDTSNPHEDFSYFSIDAYRSQEVADYVVETYVKPVTLEKTTGYVINWDVLE
jgi:hypothetical protein